MYLVSTIKCFPCLHIYDDLGTDDDVDDGNVVNISGDCNISADDLGTADDVDDGNVLNISDCNISAAQCEL